MDESKKIDTKVDLHGLPKKEIVELLSGWGYSKYHADCLWTVLYRDHLTALYPFNGLRDDLVAELRKSTTIESLEMVAAINSEDGQTQKVVFRLKDGNSIETVFMRFEGRSTVCVSTQVGCAMGCVFCATGQMGFLRDLTASEIVHQVIEADRYLYMLNAG